MMTDTEDKIALVLTVRSAQRATRALEVLAQGIDSLPSTMHNGVAAAAVISAMEDIDAVIELLNNTMTPHGTTRYHTAPTENQNA